MARQILFRTVTIEERGRTSKYKGRWLFIARVRVSTWKITMLTVGCFLLNWTNRTLAKGRSRI